MFSIPIPPYSIINQALGLSTVPTLILFLLFKEFLKILAQATQEGMKSSHEGLTDVRQLIASNTLMNDHFHKVKQ